MNLMYKRKSNVKTKIIFILCFTLSFFSVNSQVYGDKKFYLIDSVDLFSLSKNDRVLIDTTLKLYHQAKIDTIQFGLIEHIVDHCWNEDVWPKYNAFLKNEVEKKLVNVKDEQEKKSYLYFLAGTENNIGLLNDQNGNIVKAMENYRNSYKIYEDLNDKLGMAVSLNNLGIIYSLQSDTAKALEHHKKSLLLKEEIKDSLGIALSLINIGTVYDFRKMRFEALKQYQRALKISTLLKDVRGIAMANDKIGGIYYNEGFYPKALEHYNKALSIWEEIEDKVGMAVTMENISSAYFQQGKLFEAKEYGRKSFQISTSLGYPNDIKNSAFTLYKIYKKEQDHRDALKYFEIYVKMKDSIFNKETEKAVVKQTLKYEYEKIALKDSLENAKIQAQKDLEILEKENKIEQEKTVKYALSFGILLLMGLVFVSIKGYQRKKKDNELIQIQKQEVEKQKIKIENQHKVLEETHKEISDSIAYAKRIQTAILPNNLILKKHLKNGFVLYKPKDVVSGDFYWFEKIELNNDYNSYFIAAADCTGHGVPGAMVSVVCNNALNRSVREYGLSKPGEILDKTREIVMQEFEKSDEEVKDGMDISLVALQQAHRAENENESNPNSNLGHSHSASHSVQWSGANNPLWIIRNGSNQVEEYKGDKQPIGDYIYPKPFTTHEIELFEGDTFYLFTDGYADQFGGSQGKKFKYSSLKSLILSIQHKDMDSQKEILDKTFEDWKGDLEQVDDLCIIGVRV